MGYLWCVCYARVFHSLLRFILVQLYFTWLEHSAVPVTGVAMNTGWGQVVALAEANEPLIQGPEYFFFEDNCEGARLQVCDPNGVATPVGKFCLTVAFIILVIPLLANSMRKMFADNSLVARWGRSVYSNILQFIQLQLTVNVTALTITFVSTIPAGELPLTAVQFLRVNLIVAALGALRVAIGRPSDALQQRASVGIIAGWQTKVFVTFACMMAPVSAIRDLRDGEEKHIWTHPEIATTVISTVIVCLSLSGWMLANLERKMQTELAAQTLQQAQNVQQHQLAPHRRLPPQQPVAPQLQLPQQLGPVNFDIAGALQGNTVVDTDNNPTTTNSRDFEGLLLPSFPQ